MSETKKDGLRTEGGYVYIPLFEETSASEWGIFSRRFSILRPEFKRQLPALLQRRSFER